MLSSANGSVTLRPIRLARRIAAPLLPIDPSNLERGKLESLLIRVPISFILQLAGSQRAGQALGGG
jgi:hypothetical protein